TFRAGAGVVSEDTEALWVGRAGEHLSLFPGSAYETGSGTVASLVFDIVFAIVIILNFHANFSFGSLSAFLR
ncbi:MAG: hypothetical protein AAGA69_12870, partial [Pseudomonadota bacterium]